MALIRWDIGPNVLDLCYIQKRGPGATDPRHTALPPKALLCKLSMLGEREGEEEEIILAGLKQWTMT